MSQENVEVIRRMWDAFLRRDFDESLAAFHPDETVSRGAQVYWLKDGKVVRYRQCQNRADALEAAGKRE